MADEDIELPDRGYNTEDVRAVGTPPRRRRRWWLVALLSVVVVPGILFALWSWVTLSYTYSSGERAGYVQKLSRRGWLCKTWEGELAMANLPGTMPEIFRFSVRDDEVAERINRTMGARVALTYEQHKGVPTSCFGDTEYYVVHVKQVDPLPGMVVPPGVPTAPPGAPAPSGATPAPSSGTAPPPR